MEPYRPVRGLPQPSTPRPPQPGGVCEESRPEADRISSPTPATASGRESRLDEGAAPTVILKNGARLDVRIALAEWRALVGLLEAQPQVFRAALEMARGHDQPPSVLRTLRRNWLTFRTGELRPPVRDLLLSSYRETPEGPVMTFPARLADEESRVAVEQDERRVAEVLRRLADHFLANDERDGSDRGGGRGR